MITTHGGLRPQKMLRINSERSVSLRTTVIKLVVSLERLVQTRIWEENWDQVSKIYSD